MRRTVRARVLWVGLACLVVFAQALAKPSPLFEIPHLRGAWANPDTLGQGMFFDSLESERLLFAGWFTHAPDGAGHLWLTAALDVEGAMASGALVLTRGGRFAAPPDGGQHEREVGTLVIDFADCRTAHVTWTLSLDGHSEHGRFTMHPLTWLVGERFECSAPTKLRWPHAAPGLDAAAYAALVDELFIINNFSQHQQRGADPDDIYFHSGIDIVLPNGTPIHALESGVVRSITPDGPLGGSVIVQSDADPRAGWGYVHITPQVQLGQRVQAGQVLGVVRFSGVEHLHLSRMRQPASSSSWHFGDLETVNPIGWFEIPADDEPPVMRDRLLYLRDGSWDRFADGAPTVVSGDVDIVVGVHDPGPHYRQTFSGGTLGDLQAVAWLEYEIAGQGRHEFRRAWDFLSIRMDYDDTGPGARAPLTRVLYMPFLRVEPAFRWQHVHGYHLLTHGNAPSPPLLADAARAWRTAEVDAGGARRFPDGTYTITVRAGDAAGNISVHRETVEVRND